MSGPWTREVETCIMCATSNNIAENAIKEGCMEDDSTDDTHMLGKGFYVAQKHDINCNVSGFKSSLGTMRLEIVDAETVVTDSRGYECILIIHQGIYKPDEERLLLSMFQTRWSGTRVENIPTQQDEHLRFGLIF